MSCPHQPCGACVELAELDATKPTSQNFLDLIHERHHIKSTINMWHDRLAFRLPVEIISRIFVFLSKFNEPGNREFMSQREHEGWGHHLLAPLALSRVCRRWRNIVLTTPQLWTKLYFDVFTMARKLELLKEFLSRSGSLPLSLIMCGHTFEERKDPPLDAIVHLIRSYSSRWQFLDIEHVPEGFTYKLLHDLNYIPPSVLQGLRIDYFYLREPIFLREPLRPIHLCIRRMRDAAKIPLEWYNITHLEISNIKINTLLRIVEQTPRLEKWVSDGVDPSPQNSEKSVHLLPRMPIIISTLKHLDLTLKANHGALLFFSHITLPALTHLECSFEYDVEPLLDLQFDELINFLARSQLNSDRLQTFDLQYNFGLGFDPGFIELTALTHLSVTSEEDMIIDTYLSGMSNTPILPHLRKLDLRVPNMLSSTWTLLCDVLRGYLLPAGYETIGPSGQSILATTEPACLPLQFHKHPLEQVFVRVYDSNSTSMPYKEYLFLREIQKAGLIKLQLYNYRVAGHDMLQTMALVFSEDSDS